MPSPLESAGTADTWDALDRLVDELVALSRKTTTPATFHRELLRCVVEATAAQAASIWELEEGEPVVRGQLNVDDDRRVRAKPAATMVRRAFERGEPLAIGPHSGDADELAANGVGTLLLQPVRVDEATFAVLAAEFGSAISPEVRQGALQFLATVGDVAADFTRNRQRADFRRRAEAGDELESLLAVIHAQPDVETVAYAVANEGRRWCAVDRVGVLCVEHRRARLAAVSGVDRVDRRSETVRRLERLAQLVVAERRPLRPWDVEPSPLVAQALADYVEAADVKRIEILLLEDAGASDGEATTSEPRVIGVLALEQFSATSGDSADRRRTEILRRHGSLALRQALRLEGVPWGKAWATAAERRPVLRRRIVKTGAVVAVLAGLLAATFLIPARLTVEAQGVMQPRERRDVFAPLDGIVEEVFVRHGEAIAAGAPLARLRKPELEIEQTRVLGELQSSQRRLAGLRSNRTSSPPATAEERRRRQELTAEEEQLKQSTASLEQELELLRLQTAELVVRSPLAGIVTSWDVEKNLLGRPIARGALLVTVADEAGDWVLDLKIPDRRYGDVRAAVSEAPDHRPAVEFITSTRPELSFHGKLTRVAQAMTTDRTTGSRIEATVNFPRTDLPDEVRRPGAEVTAQIDCGPSSLGVVWTRDLMHFIRSRLLF